MHKKITKVHKAQMEKCWQRFPILSLADGDQMWVKKLPGESRLDIIWEGLCKVEKVITLLRWS